MRALVRAFWFRMSNSTLSRSRSIAVLAALAGLLAACGNSPPPADVADSPTNPVDPVDPNVELCSGTEINPERLFLQQVGADRAIIKWRGNVDGGDEASDVCFGTHMNALPASSLTAANVTETEHREALLTGLTPDTTYYYSVGGAASALQTRHFRTAPVTGESPADGNVRMWVLGDSGTAGSTIDPEGGDARDVRDGYLTWAASNGGEPTDLILMLGDAAYLDGTDAQFQSAVFETYPDILSSAGLWSTIGNHEMGVSGLSTATSTGLYLPAQGQRDPLPASPMPYLNIHTLPTQGENGGEPSNTEQYYSFDYGNVHVVSLDSQVAIRDSGNNETMKQWLINDLSASSNDWTLVIFHHPPYTKGSHDSDSAVLGIDQPIFDIREQYTEIFEDHGVDLAYSGHSHSYERSFYLNGHTGLEASFDPNVHAEHDGAGNPLTGQDDQEYRQISNNSGVDDKVVYTVAGSSGQATSTSDGYPHNAMAYSEIVLGSVVIDATATTLTARFINIDGDVLDFFVINR